MATSMMKGDKKTKRGMKVSRQRRTNYDIFTDKLREMSREPPHSVTNRSLREALNWDEERYDRIKQQLADEGVIRRSRGGPGGSVTLIASGEKALKVFVSYSHADEELKNVLVKHLKPLERINLIKSWHDRKLEAGDKWGDTINQNLAEADLVLLLVSIDFINSKYCYDIELDRALERRQNGECEVIPIILRGCLWQDSPFAKLQALPRDAKPVNSWSDLDIAMSNVAEGIRAVAERILSKR